MKYLLVKSDGRVGHILYIFLVPRAGDIPSVGKLDGNCNCKCKHNGRELYVYVCVCVCVGLARLLREHL